MSCFAICNNSQRLPVHLTVWQMLSVLLAVITLFAGRTFAQQTSAPADAFEPFSFALVGDPQMGYGNGMEMGSYQRFIDQARILNHLPVDFVIMPGDLVHANNAYQWRLFEQGLKQYEKQTFLIPGNHDVESLLDLDRYRDRMGDDYYDFVVHNCAFIMINSETARDETIDIGEHVAHWNWLEKTLEEHAQANRRYIFLVMHRPLYRFDHEEKDEYENWPRPARNRLLGLIEKYHVSAVLTGHLHQTTEVKLHGSDVPMYTVGGTSKIWDKKGYGYRWFKVDADGIHQDYQVFEPTWPAHWRFAGIVGYVPAILKNDMMQYGIIALHLLAMLLCLRSWRHWKYVRFTRPARFWGCATLVMLLLTLNQAMSLNELCMLFGVQLDYLPMQARGGVLVPLAIVGLLVMVSLGALIVYYRYYIMARYGWVALYAMTLGIGQLMMSMTTYDPWLSWMDSLYGKACLVGTCLLVSITALMSAASADQKVRAPARMSRPRQVQQLKVTQAPPARPARTTMPMVKAKPQTPPQPRPVKKKPVTDAFLAAQFRSGRH